MDDRLVQSALEARLVETGLEIIPENTSGPIPSGPYVRSTYSPSGSFPAAVGVDSKDRLVGAFLVDVFDPEAKGPAVAAGMAATVLAKYVRGTTLTSGAVSVTIERAYRSSGIVEDGFYQIPITIEWLADLEK